MDAMPANAPMVRTAPAPINQKSARMRPTSVGPGRVAPASCPTVLFVCWDGDSVSTVEAKQYP